VNVRCTASALIIRSLPVTGLATDTGRRMVRGQVARAHGQSFDDGWLYVDAPQGRGWCSRQYLEELEAPKVISSPAIVTPAWPKVPSGLSEIQRLFGSPGNAMASAGRVHLPKPVKLGWADQTIIVFACHKLLEDVFTSFFSEIDRRGLLGCVEIARCVQTFDGCYNDRTVTNSQKVSTHAWGIAVDINAATNRLGARPQLNPDIVAIGRDHQLVWGGAWTRPDGMHFQYATNY
jgi:hypothetical protein